MSQIAMEIPVELKPDKVLKVCLLEGDCYITDFEGLKLIEASPKWLVDITPRTLRTLKQFGFTGEVKPIIYKNKIGYFKKPARRFSEWVAIWSYFSSRGNTKAAEVLNLLAIENLGERLKGAS
ncbi:MULTISPECIES: hypothetical protein [unclassified Coleofasciculus]|uniref:hypothetical protein n=1 Tax=unclassified Coleofasciculus TaxID=2692782 RepID=UPI00187E977C|nr:MULTISPECIES: hypothetical protein [unclassified Coleofasciculus]MBE9128212.1 hypothetical protein [Coleofasciculus sp. LEGE 07081]MBE9150946.1 hypothetical protein [Coleofasciculus sp. LEGE 07092]